MKALLLTEYKKMQVTDVEEPEVGPDDVLVQVEACGICGSDIHGYDGSTGRRIPPLVMGHEAAGIVVETGENVTDLAQGTRVSRSTRWFPVASVISVEAETRISATTEWCSESRAAITVDTARSPSESACRGESSIACRIPCRSSRPHWSRQFLLPFTPRTSLPSDLAIPPSSSARV